MRADVPVVAAGLDEVRHGDPPTADGSHAHVRAHRPLEVRCGLLAVTVDLGGGGRISGVV